ncbi:MAG: PTS sugar transporter subunit IIC, partial [Lachnospiraceae bacterium]|nr:PTS sugar transporter subunit IIC [Lachnospiraceae bacterium]
MKAFLKRKNISISWKSYGIDAMSAMAQGLFASLLIGTIVKTLGEQAGNAAANIGWLKQICDWLVEIGAFSSSVAGPAMAISIAVALKAPALVVFSAAAVGQAANSKGGAGGPLAVLLIAIIAVEFGKAVSKETKIDILVTPFVTVVIGGLLSIWTAPYIGKAASKVGDLTRWATEQQPLIMGIIVSVVIGMALTLPISSAAICAALGLVGLAGGAAVAGCCAQMVGFAVLSYKENKIGGLVSQGIGTSM